jgi:nucleoside-diphosphate-sugar epimerase
MSRVLLTGASGFIGGHAIQPLLDRGFEIHAVARHAAPNGPVGHGIVWHSADLLDGAQAQALVRTVQPSHLLHCAWYVAHGKFWNAQENLDWVAASLRLLRGFAEAGGQRVVMAGTCAEYDWTGDGLCREDSTPLRPATLYGASKQALSVVLSAFARQAQLSSAWGRVFLPYGPHEPAQKLVPSVIRALLRGEPARTSHGHQVRDLIHVEDVADAFAALLDGAVQGAVNIGSGQPVRLRDVVMQIGEQIGRQELIQLGALPPPSGDPPTLVADVARLRDEVGWHPRRSLASGLADSIAWWKEELERGMVKTT